MADQSTILDWAVDRQNDEAVKLLLAAGAKPNTLEAAGISPLALACELGHPGIVSSLVGAGADVKLARPEGVTPLQLCAGASTPEVLEALIAKGAAVNGADPRGQTPLMWAARYGKADNISYLIKRGAQVNVVEKGGWTPLFFALRSKDAQAPVRLLEAGANVNAQIPGGATVVEAAVIVGNIPFAMRAVSQGANLKHRDVQGRQVIHIAAASGDADFVKLVLSKGGDANAVALPPPPVVIPDRPKPFPAPTSPLQFAARAGSPEAMKVLVDAGARKNYVGPDGLTLAMAAAGSGKLSAMQYAYELDPNLKAVARGGRSVMHVAVSNRTAPEPEAVITFLSDKGAQLDPLDERKSTPGDDLNRGGAENIRVFFIQLLRDKGIVSLAH
jgi:ankyrin repeat protein